MGSQGGQDSWQGGSWGSSGPTFTHRCKVGDWQTTLDQSRDGPHDPINGLAACRRPHPKAPVLKNSYLGRTKMAA